MTVHATHLLNKSPLNKMKNGELILKLICAENENQNCLSVKTLTGQMVLGKGIRSVEIRAHVNTLRFISHLFQYFEPR